MIERICSYDFEVMCNTYESDEYEYEYEYEYEDPKPRIPNHIEPTAQTINIILKVEQKPIK